MTSKRTRDSKLSDYGIYSEPILTATQATDALRKLSELQIIGNFIKNLPDPNSADVQYDTKEQTITITNIMADAYEIATSNLDTSTMHTAFSEKIKELNSAYNNIVINSPVIISQTDDDIINFLTQIKALPNGNVLTDLINYVSPRLVQQVELKQNRMASNRILRLPTQDRQNLNDQFNNLNENINNKLNPANFNVNTNNNNNAADTTNNNTTNNNTTNNNNNTMTDMQADSILSKIEQTLNETQDKSTFTKQRITRIVNELDHVYQNTGLAPVFCRQRYSCNPFLSF